MGNTDYKGEGGFSLEDLFEAKRREKPNPEYWEEFDRQFQEKMLGSMVDRSSAFTRLVKFTTHKLLPLSVAGAAMAAFVLSLTPFWKGSVGADTETTSSGVVAVVSTPAPDDVFLVGMLDFPEGSTAAPETAGVMEQSLAYLDTDVKLYSAADWEYATNHAVMFSGQSSGTTEYEF